MIVKAEELKISKHSIQSPEYIKEIIDKMELTLKQNPSHYFITSNMIGYTNCNIVLLNLINKKILINPKITNYGDNKVTNFMDTSLLLPNEIIETTRYSKIIVKSDNFEKPILFGVDKVETEDDMMKLLECGYLQNAIDTLNGKTMYYNQTSILNKKLQDNVFYDMSNDKYTRKVKGKFVYRELAKGFKLI